MMKKHKGLVGYLETRELGLDEVVKKVKKEHNIKKIAIPFVYAGLGLWDGISGQPNAHTLVAYGIGALGYSRLFNEFDSKGRYNTDAAKVDVALHGSWQPGGAPLIYAEHLVNASERKLKRVAVGTAIIGASYALGYGIGKLVRLEFRLS